ncbi:hypothetical protein E2C01_041468 [Portunus trituberculatus]|uniref:Uncharacterized protein n=1 Tax=Portunus trituberculatus TaxID=210409 RepID=A0A5B7FTM7_PORTR|nr:hypothetical protein [Portunus trituberculatus]
MTGGRLQHPKTLSPLAVGSFSNEQGSAAQCASSHEVLSSWRQNSRRGAWFVGAAVWPGGWPPPPARPPDREQRRAQRTFTGTSIRPRRSSFF